MQRREAQVVSVEQLLYAYEAHDDREDSRRNLQLHVDGRNARVKFIRPTR